MIAKEATARALGACGVVLSPTAADPLSRKAVRCSMGASLRLPFARSGGASGAAGAAGAAGEEGLAGKQQWATDLLRLKRHGVVLVALCLSPTAVVMDELPAAVWGRDVALVCGNEGDGCGAEVLELADYHVRLRMGPVDAPGAGIDSLSVGVAAGIALAAAVEKQRQAAGLG